MKYISLSQGKRAIVDDEDYEWLNQWKWSCYKSRNTFYAQSVTRLKNGKFKWFSMHRAILGIIDPNMQIDHINRRGLDNRKNNLRFCSSGQNRVNCRKQKTSIKKELTSIYKGVGWDKKLNKWRVRITTKEKTITLGWFDDEYEAALTYDRAACKYHKEFAKTNF